MFASPSLNILEKLLNKCTNPIWLPFIFLDVITLMTDILTKSPIIDQRMSGILFSSFRQSADCPPTSPCFVACPCFIFHLTMNLPFLEQYCHYHVEIVHKYIFWILLRTAKLEILLKGEVDDFFDRFFSWFWCMLNINLSYI